ncbi:MAG: rRNA (uracil1498-N3)-methyltransferase [Acidobacteriota bacterium]|jgi:16S rRNA (uracil1498-N3)-methyltransferase|nr:rRNA (uracil1498-N3)-methyltransferase [Acidobacteriota bacterium]
MARRRFFSPPETFAADGSTVDLRPEEARHLRNVLRLVRGDEVFVFDGEGKEFRCLVDDLGRDKATLGISGEVEPARPESPLQLTIAVALLKGEKLDLVVQKVTELGATRIVPLVSKLADVRLRDESDAQKRVLRLRRIAIEACKQSGRAAIPEIATPIAFNALIDEDSSRGDEWRVMFAERDGSILSDAIESMSTRPKAVTALVGSEGGWTDEEIARARSAGWDVITLGGRIVRAETAAMAVTTLLQHLFGDLK